MESTCHLEAAWDWERPPEPNYFPKQNALIPVCWLTFFSREQAEGLANEPCVIDRKTALENYKQNIQFVADVFEDKLPVLEASSRLTDRIQKSRAKNLTVEISDLISSVGLGPQMLDVVDAIWSSDAERTLTLPPQEVMNPGTGEMVRMREQKWTNTRQMIQSLCWISDRDLDNNDEFLDELVTGYIWD